MEKTSHYNALKERPCSVIHTLDAVRWNRVVGRTIPLAYIRGCVMTRPAQLQRRVLGYKRKPLKLHLLWIAVLKKASTACFGGVFWHRPKIMYPSGPVNAVRPVNHKGSGWHCFFKSIKVKHRPSSIMKECVSLFITVMLAEHKKLSWSRKTSCSDQWEYQSL